MYQLSDIDWFEWNGTKCTEYGVHVLRQPAPIRPIERISEETIPGRSETLTLKEGNDIYDGITMQCTCIIGDMYSEDANLIAKFNGWLRGSGIVTFANRQEGFYKARIANQISFDQVLAGHPHRTFSVQFQCSPFLYLYSGMMPTVYSNTQQITNKGNIPSLPLIKVTGNAEGNLMIGGSTMIINDFTGLDYIMIDNEAKIVYKGEKGNATDPLTLLGTRVTGEWMNIPTGNSFISYTGGIQTVTITPRWRCIG